MNPTKTTIRDRVVQLVVEAYDLGISVADDLPNRGLHPLMDEAMTAIQDLRRSKGSTGSLETVTTFMVIYLSEAFDVGVADARGEPGTSIGALLDNTRTLVEEYLSSAT